jgi:hypothetical protein
MGQAEVRTPESVIRAGFTITESESARREGGRGKGRMIGEREETLR